MAKKKLKTEDIQFFRYNITEEPIEDKHTRKIPKEIYNCSTEITEMIYSQPKKILPQLLEYIKKYPDVPILYNYICAAYANIDLFDKVEFYTLKNLEKNPDYLFAKLNYADVCLRKKEFKKIPGIFDHKLDLKLLYPARSTFHISEFAGFTGIMCRYHMATGERHIAKKKYHNLKKIAPQHPRTKEVGSILRPSLISLLFKPIEWYCVKNPEIPPNIFHSIFKAPVEALKGRGKK